MTLYEILHKIAGRIEFLTEDEADAIHDAIDALDPSQPAPAAPSPDSSPEPAPAAPADPGASA